MYDDVITQYYHNPNPNPNPNQKNNPKCRPRIPNPNTKAATRPKRRRVAALVLGLGILDTALYLNQLIRDPGRGSARSTSHFIFLNVSEIIIIAKPLLCLIVHFLMVPPLRNGHF